MLIKQISTPGGVFYIKKLNTKIAFKTFSTISKFFFDRNFDFRIFFDSSQKLTFFQKIKKFFERNPYKYDPFNEDIFFELQEKMTVYKSEELMHIYYSEYWESWEDNLAYVDPKNPLSYFVNFEGTPILYPLTQASYMAKHYPFEMYSLAAVSKDFYDDYRAYDATSFDSTYHDPYTGEDLELPLTTLRWNYYIENFMEENLTKFYKSSKFTYAFGLSSKLLDDLEENNDLISSVLETIHEPTFRNTIEYDEYLKFAKIRLDLSFMLFVEYNTARSVSLLTIPWIFLFGIGDLLTNEFSNLTIIFCDLKSIFLYLFFGQELVWQFEETFKEYVSNIFSGVKYSVYNRKYKKHYTTFKNDISKIWRLINLKTAEPKLYKKLKQYILLSIKKKNLFFNSDS